VKRWILDSVSAAGAHSMGRVTYEEMASVWPISDSDFTLPMNEVPKVVFSKTLERGEWPETHIARGDLRDEIEQLKREPGADLIA
jgi:dihydrofolate reductase